MSKICMVKANNEMLNESTIEDVRLAISELIERDDVFGDFWVSTEFDTSSSISLQTYRNLSVILSYVEDIEDDFEEEINVKVETWEEIEDLHKLFYNLNFDKIKEILRNIINISQEVNTWVLKCSNSGGDISLEANRNLTVIYTSIKDTGDWVNDQIKELIKVKMESWEAVKQLHELFLDSNFSKLKEILRNKIVERNEPG